MDEPPRPAREPIFNPQAFDAAPVLALVTAMAIIHLWIDTRGIAEANAIYWRWSFVSARLWAGEGLPTLLTYAMLHGSWGHLAMNGVILYALGSAVWRVTGTVRFMALFAVTSICGALAFALIRPDEAGPLVGASGGVFGMLGAVKRLEFAMRAMRGEPVGGEVLRFLGLIVALEVAVGLATGGVIAWQAHLGGLLAGFALAPIFVRRRR